MRRTFLMILLVASVPAAAAALKGHIDFTATGANGSDFYRQQWGATRLKMERRLAANAQETTHVHARPPKLSVAVNGAVSPQSIPDDLAYVHFLRALAAPSPTLAQRRDAVLNQVGLSTPDRLTFATALMPLTSQLAALAKQGATNRSTEESRSLERSAFESARTTILQSLSPTGREKLDVYVREHVKRRIVIYRG